jgi:hypothetical protein
MCGGDERCIRGLVGNLRERDHLGDPGIDGRINLKCICKKWSKRWRIWLRHCATSRKVTGLFSDGVIGIFY